MYDRLQIHRVSRTKCPTFHWESYMWRITLATSVLIGIPFNHGLPASKFNPKAVPAGFLVMSLVLETEPTQLFTRYKCVIQEGRCEVCNTKTNGKVTVSKIEDARAVEDGMHCRHIDGRPLTVSQTIKFSYLVAGTTVEVREIYPEGTSRNRKTWARVAVLELSDKYPVELLPGKKADYIATVGREFVVTFASLKKVGDPVELKVPDGAGNIEFGSTRKPEKEWASIFSEYAKFALVADRNLARMPVSNHKRIPLYWSSLDAEARRICRVHGIDATALEQVVSWGMANGWPGDPNAREAVDRMTARLTRTKEAKRLLPSEARNNLIMDKLIDDFFEKEDRPKRRSR